VLVRSSKADPILGKLAVIPFKMFSTQTTLDGVVISCVGTIRVFSDAIFLRYKASYVWISKNFMFP
jgi:hypothetical protein